MKINKTFNSNWSDYPYLFVHFQGNELRVIINDHL